MTKQYYPLRYGQRCQIAVLIKRAVSQWAMANALGVSQSTINRGLAKIRVESGIVTSRHTQRRRRSIFHTLTVLGSEA
jgi:IS30 family transposase